MVWAVCAVMVIAAGGYVLYPLFRRPEGTPESDIPDETDLDRMLERKSVIYRSIKDLEFEHAMGRLSDADYRRLDADYKNDAALILQQLDQMGASEDLDNAIEKEIAARKAAPSSAPADRKTYRCPACGAEVVAGKKFCADCGKRL